jgi:hypothetical protein
VTRVQVEEPTFRLNGLVWRGSMGAIGLAGRLIVIVFLVFYLLTNGDLYKKSWREYSGRPKRISVGILNDITTQIERFWWLASSPPSSSAWRPERHFADCFATGGVGRGRRRVTTVYVGPWFVSIAAGPPVPCGSARSNGRGGWRVAAATPPSSKIPATPLLMGRTCRMNAVAVRGTIILGMDVKSGAPAGRT